MASTAATGGTNQQVRAFNTGNALSVARVRQPGSAFWPVVARGDPAPTAPYGASSAQQLDGTFSSSRVLFIIAVGRRSMAITSHFWRHRRIGVKRANTTEARSAPSALTRNQFHICRPAWPHFQLLWQRQRHGKNDAAARITCLTLIFQPPEDNASGVVVLPHAVRTPMTKYRGSMRGDRWLPTRYRKQCLFIVSRTWGTLILSFSIFAFQIPGSLAGRWEYPHRP